VDAVLGDLGRIMAAASLERRWDRLKACCNDHCRWVVYDSSKNRSARWCSMQACGGRAKASAHRRRRAAQR
jgi:predicted RNA-binding Zn ribbon-like protein